MRTLGVAGIGVLFGLLAAVPVSAQPYVYVLSSGYSCSGRGCDTSRIANASVVVLDARTNQKVSTISLPGFAGRMAFAPDGRRLFITTDRGLSAADPATNKVLWSIDVGPGQFFSAAPEGIAVSPDGSRVYLTANRSCALPCSLTGALIELEAGTGAILRTADGGSRAGPLLLSPSGHRAYVSSNSLSPEVTVIDTGLMSVVATVAMAANAPVQSMAIAPDGERLYVGTANGTHTNNVVTVVNTATNTIAAQIFVSAGVNLGDTLISAMTITPDGSRLLLARLNEVTTIDTAQAAVAATVPIPGFGEFGGRIVAASNTTAYVTRRTSGNTDLVAAIDLPTGAVVPVPAVRDAIDIVVAPAAVRPPSRCAFTLSGAEVSGSTLILPADAPRLGVDVAADCTWTAATDAAWLSLSGIGTGTGLLGSAGTNDTLRPRRGTLTVTSPTMSAAYTVVQRAVPKGAIVIDAPSSGGTVPQPFTIGGWAIVQGALTPPGVGAVHIWAYPASGTPPIFVGSAPYGEARPDVAALFGQEYLSSGFTLQARGLFEGRYLLAVFALNNETRGFDVVASTSVTVASNASDPRMNVEVPVADATVSSGFAIGGWALDRGGSDSGVDAVHVWAYPEGNGAPVFLGAAARGRRPDVAAIFGPRFEMAGFHLSGSLPPGAYRLAVFARSTVTGTFNNVRAFRIVVTPPASSVSR